MPVCGHQLDTQDSNLNELHVPDDADEATRWGIWEEFSLRWDAWQRHEDVRRFGVLGALRRFSRALTGEEHDERE